MHNWQHKVVLVELVVDCRVPRKNKIACNIKKVGRVLDCAINPVLHPLSVHYELSNALGARVDVKRVVQKFVLFYKILPGLQEILVCPYKVGGVDRELRYYGIGL